MTTSCKRCAQTDTLVKNGRIRSQQRYLCKHCRYNFVPGDRRQDKGYPTEVKALAVLLYGTMKSSYGMIARLLGTTRKTVYFWIRKAGSQLPEPPISENIKAIEFDEMWHFISKKQDLDMESIRSLFSKVHRLGRRP
jgi:transposase-like protein